MAHLNFQNYYELNCCQVMPKTATHYLMCSGSSTTTRLIILNELEICSQLEALNGGKMSFALLSCPRFSYVAHKLEKKNLPLHDFAVKSPKKLDFIIIILHEFQKVLWQFRLNFFFFLICSPSPSPVAFSLLNGQGGECNFQIVSTVLDVRCFTHEIVLDSEARARNCTHT